MNKAITLAFLSYGTRAGDFEMARRMIQSALRWMPSLIILHQTDDKTPVMPGANKWAPLARLHGGEELFGDYRARQLCALGDEPVIIVDTDIIFQADVRDLFEQDFDVALTERSEMEAGGVISKYIGGFMLSRSRAFWNDVAEVVANQPGPLREWWGIQLAMDEVVARGTHKVLTLPERIFNRAPRDPDDTQGAAVLHYRGERKKWMLERAE